MKRVVQSYSLLQLLSALFILIIALVLLSSITPRHGAFISSELLFTDPSKRGLQIMPASCASNPMYFHYALPVSGDAKGFWSYNGTTEVGALSNGLYVCVTNTSGAGYFIPANTAAEIQAFKNLGSTQPGLTVY